MPNELTIVFDNYLLSDQSKNDPVSDDIFKGFPRGFYDRIMIAAQYEIL